MTEAQKQDFFLFLQKFCSDNVGNRLNEWLIEAFLNRAHQKLLNIPGDQPENHPENQAGDHPENQTSPHDALKMQASAEKKTDTGDNNPGRSPVRIGPMNRNIDEVGIYDIGRIDSVDRPEE